MKNMRTRVLTSAMLVVAAGVGAVLAASYFRAELDERPRAEAADQVAVASDGPDRASIQPRESKGRSARGGPPPTRQDAVERVRRHVAEKLEAHQAEPVDPGWGPRAQRELTGDLEEVSQGSPAQLVEVDCRTSSCVALLEWPNYHVAFDSYRYFLMQPYHVNCQRTIAVPPPRDADQPYRAHMFMNCEDRERSEEG